MRRAGLPIPLCRMEAVRATKRVEHCESFFRVLTGQLKPDGLGGLIVQMN